MIYCVDLDGTLSKGDMSLRAFVYLSIRNPLWIVKAAFYLLAKFGDRKLLKSKMNEHYKFKVEDLYFNEELINFLKEDREEEIFIIGGKQIYSLALPYADRLYITHINAEHEGNVYFPKIDYSKYEKIKEENVGVLSFCVYEKIKVNE